MSIILVLFLAKMWHLLFSNYSQIICQGLAIANATTFGCSAPWHYTFKYNCQVTHGCFSCMVPICVHIAHSGGGYGDKVLPPPKVRVHWHGRPPETRAQHLAGLSWTQQRLSLTTPPIVTIATTLIPCCYHSTQYVHSLDQDTNQSMNIKSMNIKTYIANNMIALVEV